jgi:hypothetical protein
MCVSRSGFSVKNKVRRFFVCQWGRQLGSPSDHIVFRFEAGTKRGEVDLHLLHVPEVIERAEQSIKAATSKGDWTILGR